MTIREITKISIKYTTKRIFPAKSGEDRPSPGHASVEQTPL